MPEVLCQYPVEVDAEGPCEKPSCRQPRDAADHLALGRARTNPNARTQWMHPYEPKVVRRCGLPWSDDVHWKSVDDQEGKHAFMSGVEVEG